MPRSTLKYILTIAAALAAPSMTVASPVPEDPQPQQADSSVLDPFDPLAGLEVPASMEELLANPHFDAEPGQDCAYYLERAEEIRALRSRYTSRRKKKALKEISEAKSEIQKNWKKPNEPVYYGELDGKYSLLAAKYEREDCETVSRKFKETLYPLLLPFALSDDISEEESARALSYCIQCLHWTRDYDKLEEIRSEQLAKESRALADGNDALSKRCDAKIRALDKILFSLYGRLGWSSTMQGKASDDFKEKAAKLGDRILEEIDRDPRLTLHANKFYITVGLIIDSDIALKFREKILSKFDEEKARREFEKEHGHSARDVQFAILKEPQPVDEALLTVERDQTNEYYNKRQEELTKLFESFSREVHEESERRDGSRKIFDAIGRARFWNAVHDLKERKTVRNADLLTQLSPEDVEYAEKEYEAAKGSIRKGADEKMLFALSYAFEAQKLLDALETSLAENSDAAFKTATLSYIAEAKKNDFLAQGAAQMGSFIASRDFDSGILFLNYAIRKFRELSGPQPKHATSCVKALDDLQEQAERRARREAATQDS